MNYELESQILFQRFGITGYDLGEKTDLRPFSDEVDRESTDSEKGQNLEKL